MKYGTNGKFIDEDEDEIVHIYGNTTDVNFQIKDLSGSMLIGFTTKAGLRPHTEIKESPLLKQLWIL